MSNISTMISYVSEYEHQQTHLAWPCKLYKVIVPVEQKQTINLFEETILSLMAENLVETKALSDYIGLPVEFVRFVKERLKHTELIDKRLQLTEKGKKAISLLNEQVNTGREESLNIYVDLISGQTLDVVSVGTVRTKDFDHAENHRVELNFGTVGKSKRIQAMTLKYQSAHLKLALNTSEIHKTFKKFQKRQKNLNFHPEEQQDLNIDLLPSSFTQISSISEAEIVYLHCLASLDQSTNRIVVSDGLGYSRLLSNYLPKENERQIKKRFLSQNVTPVAKISQEKVLIIDNLEQIFKLKSELDYLLQQTLNTNIDGAMIDKHYELLKILYDTLEHALYDLDQQFKYSDYKNNITLDDDVQKNSQYLAQCAHKLGFKISEEIQQELFYVTFGQVKAIDFGKKVLKPLLAKHLSTSHILHQHPFKNIAGENHLVLESIRQLHRLRNKSAHAEFFNKINLKFFTKLYEDIIKIIFIIYPQAQNVKNTQNNITLNDISQQNLRAELRLDQYFPNYLPNLVYAKLLHLFKLPMSINKIQGKEIELIENGQRKDYLLRLTVSLEATLKYALQNLSINVGNLSFIEKAQREVFLSILNDAPIPKVISKIKIHQIKYVMQSTNGTLLPLMSAFFIVLYIEYSDIFQEMMNQFPHIFEDFILLHELRDHGNQVTERLENLSVEELMKLQCTIFNLIKFIVDIT